MARNLLACTGSVALIAAVVACGSSSSSDFKNGGGGNAGGGVNNGPLGGGFGTGAGGGGTTGSTTDGGGATGPGGSMGVPQNCSGGGSTTISGTVYDPAMQDPLYNVTVYVPKSATLPALMSGASCNTCASLYPEILASAVTDANGNFKIPNAPWGSNLPLVVQTGKWRKEYTLANVTQCKDNPQPDKTLRLPKNAIHGDGNLPDIAISTGNADSLECLLLRIGVDADEWIGGAGAQGHIHIFRGNGANTMNAAPESFMSLWDQTADLMKYDVTLLSCEGSETSNLSDANRQSLLDYANAGGRVFASHYHYSWFNVGPWATFNLATWYRGSNPFDPGDMNHISFPGDVYTTLLKGGIFPEGVALKEWLGNVNALTNGQLPIYYARHNSDLLPPAGPGATPSQPWIVAAQSVMATAPKGTPVAGAAQYFSVDTPVTAAQKCGRVVYSDLHVSGGAASMEPAYSYFSTDYPGLPLNSPDGVVPSGCAMHPLTPQEKALEFMIFDLSSCLIPIGAVPMAPASGPPR